MTNYAQTEDRSAKICTSFGESLARQWFGDDVVDNLPTYVRGPNKGKPKGYLKWRKVVKGGWVHYQTYGPGDHDGEVLRPNQILYKWIELPEWGSSPEIVAGAAPRS
jgi:hypothetical protein